MLCFLSFPGSRTVAPVPRPGTEAAAADRGESQGALWLRVEGPAAERIRGCEDLPHPGIRLDAEPPTDLRPL